jgi:hypothetical protein
MAFLKILAPTLALLGTFGTAMAQESKPAVHLLIEDLSADASKCGLSTQLVRGAANSSLRYNRVRTGESSTINLTLYVNIIIRYADGLCYTHTNVSLYKNNKVDLPYIGSVFASVEFCDKGIMAASLPQDPRALGDIKSLTDACLASAPPNVLAAVS